VLAATVATATVAADQLSKYFVRRSAADLPLDLLPHVSLELSHNSGISFGRLTGAGWLLVGVVVAVIVVLIYALVRCSPRYAVALALIIGGAVGNLVDRIRFGSVVDFVSIGAWPTFNVADAAIAVGAVTIVVRLLFSERGQDPDACLSGRAD
jgi:signal peptidase II